MNSRHRPSSHLMSTWQLVARRTVAHWRLLSSVVVGVLLACSMMASTVIYFDALRNLALKSILDKVPESEVNVILVTEKGPTNRSEYTTVTSIVVDQINPLVGWLAKRIEQTGKSSVFALANPDDPDSLSTAWDRDGRSNFIFIRDLEDHLQIRRGGRFPHPGILNSPDEPLSFEALVPADQAASFNIAVGDQIAAITTSEGSSPFILVTVSGLFDLAPGDVALRDLDERVMRRGTQINFRPLQFYISEDVYLDNLGPAFPKLDTIYAWHVEVDRTRLNARNSLEALVGITLMRNRLGSSLFAFEQITSIDKALREFERRHFFTKLPMLVAIILIVIVILYYIVMVASLVVARQRSEIVLLRSRGASSYQIFSVFLLEASTVSLIAAIAGPLIAVSAIGLIGYAPAFSGLTDGSALPATMSPSSFGLSAVGGILTLCALTIPAIQASRIGVTRYRQESSRPLRQSWFQQYYLDIAILIVSIFMFRQLSEQGSVVATNIFGDRVVDQVLLAMPALVLLASAMVLLRLLPLTLSLGSRFMAKWLPAGPVLGLWQMARNPTHYARLSLLLILMAGLGIFVASVGGTLKLNYQERILYKTGSDMRVEGIMSGPRGFTTPFIDQYREIEGITEAMGAYRGRAFDLSHTPGRSVSILGIDTQDFQEVAWYREDFADISLQTLLGTLLYEQIPEGLAIPQNTTHINAIVKTDRPYESLEMILRVRDVNNRYFSYSFGKLDFNDTDEYGKENLEADWTTMSTSLHGKRLDTSSPWLLPVPPLQLVSIVVSERDDRKMLESGWILIDEITATIDNSEEVTLDSFDDAQDWSVLTTTPESVSDKILYSKGMGRENGDSVLFAWSKGRSMTSRGIYHGSTVAALPVLAGPKFLSDSGHAVGDEFEITVGGGQLLARINGTVDYFPTLDTLTERWIIADLMALVALSNIEATFAEMAVPNEAWLSIEEEFSDRVGLAEYLKTKGIPPEFFTSPVVYDQKSLLDLTRVDPLLDAGWRALLIVAFSIVLVLSCIGLLLHTYVSFRDREGQFALLRAVGFSLNQIATLVWIEQAIVVLTGLALGTWMGGQVGSTIMTFLGHDDMGERVLPPYTLDVDWITLLFIYSLILVVFSIVIAAVVMVIKRLSLQKLLRFGE